MDNNTDNKGAGFSSNDIKRAPELITRVKQKKPPLKDRIKSFFKKHKKPLIIAGSSILGAVVIAAGILIFVFVIEPAQTPAVTNEEVIETAYSINALDPDLSDPVAAEEEKQTVLDSLEQQSNNLENEEKQPTIDNLTSLTLYKYGDYQGAVDNHLKIIARLESESDKNYEGLIESYGFLAQCYLMLGDTGNAIAAYESVLAVFDSAVSAGEPVTGISKAYYEGLLSDLKES